MYLFRPLSVTQRFSLVNLGHSFQNVVFPAQAEYSYFSADFNAENILVLFLNCSLLADSSVLE